MGLTKNRVVLASLVLTETAWFYAFASVMGAAGSAGGSPLGYFTLIGLLSVTIIVFSYVRWRDFEGHEIAYAVAIISMVSLVYLAVAHHIVPGEFNLGWILRMREYYLPEGYALRGIAGTLIGLGVIVRGIRLVLLQVPDKSFNLTFRVGLFFMGVSAIVDIILAEQLNVFIFMVIFFAAGLAGLNLGHLVPESAASAKARTWQRIIGGGVGGVILIALFVTAINRGIFSIVTDPLQSFFLQTARGLAIIVGVPLLLIYERINRAYESFFGDEEFISEFGSGQGWSSETSTKALNYTTTSEYDHSGSFSNAFMEDPELLTRIFVWIFIVFIVVIVASFMFLLLRKLVPESISDSLGSRESISEELDIGSDLWEFFRNLIPNFGFNRGGRGFNIPNGPPGFMAALRIYYEMLSTARSRKVNRSPHLTPTEFTPHLGTVFPDDLVGSATNAFNRAQYGNIPASDEEIKAIEESYRTLSNAEVAELRKKQDDASTQSMPTQPVEENPSISAVEATTNSSPYPDETLWERKQPALAGCGMVLLFALLAVLGVGLIFFALVILPG